MPLPTTNLGLSNIQAEFGGTNPAALSEYVRGGSYVSNQVTGINTTLSNLALSQFKNKTKVSISNSSSTVNEGSSVTFTVTTATVSNGTVFYWAAISTTGATATDILGDSPLGSITINSNSATITLSVKLDTDTPETGESFAIRLYYTQSDRDNFINEFAQSNTVSINNATYSISPASSNVNEGNSLTINVTTSNITDSTTLYWTINHTTTSSSDFSINSGSFSIVSNSGSFSVGPLADQVTEGAESFTVSIRAYSTTGTVLATSSSITINDTSTTPSASATLSASPTSITSGGGSTLSWTTTNATSASIDNGVGSVSTGSSSTTVYPTSTTTYTITPYYGGTAGTTASATVTVYPVASSTLSASPTSIVSGNSSTLNWTMTNSSLVFGGVINPGNISVNGSSGSVSVSPTTTTTYTITPYNALNSAGTTASATVTVTEPPPNPQISSVSMSSANSLRNGASYTLTVTRNGTYSTADNITLVFDQKAPNNFYSTFGPNNPPQLVTIASNQSSGTYNGTVNGAALQHNATITATGSYSSGSAVWTGKIGGDASTGVSYVSFNVTNTNYAQANTTDVSIYLISGQTLQAGTTNLSGTTSSGDTYIRLLDSGGSTVASNDDYSGVASYFSYSVTTTGTYTLKFGAYSSGSASGTGGYVIS